ncbi:MAG: PDZ domain-containing protein, partial [Acidobacteriota bacterium]|nr:PDZ domain-containing protein [Acidobacteriota bacterium]
MRFQDRRATALWAARFVMVIAIGLVTGSFHAADKQSTRLLRFPDIHGDRVVFVHAGDIWIASSRGGEGHRLTGHTGQELFPKFSPDGSRVAYSAEYSGNRQVWVMDADGSNQRQLTFYNDVGPMPPRGGFDYRVLDWTRDGKHVVFRANRLPWGVRLGRPYVVPVDGGMEQPLAVPETGGGMLSPDGKQYVYTPIDREFRTWKRYRGGRAQDVWIFDLESHDARQLTDHVATDNQPVWVEDSIYFTSDREKRLNLYAMTTSGEDLRRVTNHENFDVLWPSAGPKQVVYEAGGSLHRFDPGADESERIDIRLNGNFVGTIAGLRNVSDWVTGGDISPTGKRAVFVARGEMFTVPAEDGSARNLTRSAGVRELHPAWSPDGRLLAYQSDRSGEYEIYVRRQDGKGEERRVTSGGDVWRFPPVWSPDSKMLAWGDRSQRLRYVTIDTGRVTDVDHSDYNDITSYSWSPDSRWLAYTKNDASQFSSVYVHDLESGDKHRLTDEFTNDYQPVFGGKGDFLYFLSDRDYNLTFSGYEFNYFYTRPTRIYAATLSSDGPSLLKATSDEEPFTESEESEEEEADDDEAEGEDVRVTIDVEGIAHRVVALPASAGNYGSLAGTEDGLVFAQFDQNSPPSIRQFNVESEETETILEGSGNYALSANGSKLLVAQGENWRIIDRKAGQDASSGGLDLSGLVARVDPAAEWLQIFNDAWRITRDWFYDPEMHGVDWDAIHDLYEPLVEHVHHRADLDYILGEMGGELNAGHYYVNSGDMPTVPRRDGGLLGAEIQKGPSGFYRVAEVFPGENWHDAFRSPLTETGVNVHEGDWILAVDGVSTKGVDNFYRLLEGTAGHQVELLVNDRPKEEGARVEIVRPLARETNLRYLKWTQSRRDLVDRLSGGRVGYIHLPNTATDGNRELRKYFYPQADRDALVIDVRYNGGGFIPDRMVELLTRERLNYWKFRGVEPNPTPQYSHVGPKVCLTNHYSSSGGDAFPYYFKKLGLGPLLGTRTWGGLI